ncbi:MAG: HEAT repeat domain-containing protein [Candidatus Brocadiae bacterium]|nr:HEAT repeat domain-containing protein [Candidatus Brocadiia bacterium]
MKKNIAIGLGLVFFCAAFVILVFLPQDSSFLFNKPPDVKHSPQEKASVKITPVSLKYAHNTGDHFIYDFSYNTNGSMSDTKAEKPGYSPLAFKLQGKLHKKVYEVKEEGAFIGYSIMTSGILLGEADKETAQRYIEALKTEVYVVVNNMGFSKRWYFPQSIPGNLSNIVKSLLLNAQVILPETALVEWTTEETDQNGFYRAQYSLKEDGKIHKKKLEYVESIEGLKIYSCNSSSTIDFHQKDGYIDKIAFEEQVQYQAINIITNVNIKIDMSLETKTNDAALAGTLQSKLKKESYTISASSSIEGQEEMERMMLRKRIGNMTWKDFAEKIQNAKDRKDCPELILQLKAWMQLNPTKLYMAAQKILESKELTPGVYSMIRALGSVEPHGQDVLVDVLKKKSENQEYVYESLRCLSLVNKPTNATIEIFQDLSKNHKDETIKSTALLGLGSLASRFIEESPEKAALIVYDLEQKLQSSSDKSEKIRLIDSLGNAGSASSLPYLANLIQDKDIAIRGSALLALRSINDSRADDLLTNTIKENKDYATLRNALDAIEYRQPNATLFSAVKQKVTEEKSEELKIRQIKILWNMRKAFPEAEIIVRGYANNDPSEKVKNNAKAMMLSSGVRY